MALRGFVASLATILAAAALALGSAEAQARQPATIYVNGSAIEPSNLLPDPGGDSSCNNPNYNNIKAAVADAPAGSVIQICGGLYLQTEQIAINKSLTLKGAGGLATTLDGNNAVQFLSITSGDVVIEDLAFRRGWEVTGGGAIFVALETASLTIRRSTFFANKTDGSGGAIYAFRGCCGDSNPLMIFDSTFVGNEARNGEGGAVLILGGSAAHRIANSTFQGNFAGFIGGAVSVNMSDGASFAFDTFVDNATLNGTGRAFYLNGSLTVEGSVFADSRGATGTQCEKDAQSPITYTEVLATGEGCGASTPVDLARLNLGFLGNFGGPNHAPTTQTLELGADSALIGAATSNCPDFDQRGESRGTPCTIGAVEYKASSPAVGPKFQLVSGKIGEPITVTAALTTSNFEGPVTYELTPTLPGMYPLPSGLEFSTSTGVLSGTPESKSKYYYLVTARDSHSHVASAQLRLLFSTLTPQRIVVTTKAPAWSAPSSTFTVAAEANAPVSITTSGACSGSGLSSAAITMAAEPGVCFIAYDQSGTKDFGAASTVTETTTSVKKATTVAYTGGLTGKVGDKITMTATVTGDTCPGPVFALDRNPNTSASGAYVLTRAENLVDTAGWKPGDYTLTVTYGGDGCLTSTDTETLKIAAKPLLLESQPIQSSSTTDQATPSPIAVAKDLLRGVGAVTGDNDFSSVLLVLGLLGAIASGSVLLGGVSTGQWRTAIFALPILLGFLVVRALVAAWDFAVTWLPSRRDS